MKRTAHQEAKVFNLTVPVGQTAGTVTGTGIDCNGFEEALVLLAVGVVPSNGTLDVHLEESDALGSGYVDITSAVFAQKAAANGSLTYAGRVDLKKRKRYIRAVAVIANQTIPFWCGAVLSEAKIKPVTQVNTAAFNV